jgi:hypothetical protein
MRKKFWSTYSAFSLIAFSTISAPLRAKKPAIDLHTDCSTRSAYLSFKNLNHRLLYSLEIQSNKQLIDQIQLAGDQNQLSLNYYPIKSKDSLQVSLRQKGLQKPIVKWEKSLESCRNEQKKKVCEAYIPTGFTDLVQYCVDADLFNNQYEFLSKCSYMSNTKQEFSLCLKNDSQKACLRYAPTVESLKFCQSKQIDVPTLLNCKELPTDSELHSCIMQGIPSN